MSTGTPAPKKTVLVVDDDASQADLLAEVLVAEGFDARSAHGPEAALKQFKETPPDALVTDWRMPGMTGLALFLSMRESRRDLVGIVVTAFGTMETAVEAMKAGIADFASKPVDAEEIAIKLRKALRLRTLERENSLLRASVEAEGGATDIVGRSSVLKDIVDRATRAAQSRANVLLTGESGTGKELLARHIHASSPRRAGPYIRVNCAAMPEALLESELFGFRKGAFTGAIGDRKGRFDLADGGTIFLDEIGEIPLHLQAKLLRVLQEHEVEPLGAEGPHPVDVRVIAATNRDLKKQVADGAFREDLRYRLHVVELRLPALRERRGDIPLLAESFLARYATRDGRPTMRLSEAAHEALAAAPWPGNVRELENAVERAVVLSRGDVLEVADLGLESSPEPAAIEETLKAILSGKMTLDGLERSILLESLRRCEGNFSRTARALGITRRALQYRMERIREASPESES